MKNKWKILGVAAVSLVLTACLGGGGGGSTGGSGSTPTPTPSPTPTTYTISGNVSGLVQSGVAINVSPGNFSATTDANGNYSIAGLTAGTYTVTPAFAGQAIYPASKKRIVNTAALSISGYLTAVNFVAANSIQFTGGASSIPDTSLVSGDATFGTAIFKMGGKVVLNNPSPSSWLLTWDNETGGGGVVMTYDASSPAGDRIEARFFSNGLIGMGEGFRCGTTANVLITPGWTSMGALPICSSIGVTFDRTAGNMTLSNTPIYFGTTVPTLPAVNATGTLTFTPF